jgi:ABC-2 type transport system ATP-binding protein
MTAISVRHIIKRFGNHIAVDGVTFTVPTGCIYGILGPNGAGKSTTLRMINDIIAPDGGDIELLGGLKPGRDASARIGYLPEERGLYTKMKVAAMIQFMGELRGLSATVAKQRTGQWLDKLGLAQWSDNKVQDLSKGMQQKVQFATALIHQPELVILDEPWSGLDPINAEVLQDTVAEIRAAGRTVLFSTHQMEQAEKICDEVCIIARGKVVLAGALAEIKRNAAVGHQVALEFADQAERERARNSVLTDKAWVAAVRAGRNGHSDEVLLDLAVNVDLQSVLAHLVSQRVMLTKFELVVPSLHQIFVDRVGAANAMVAERRSDAGSSSKIMGVAQ